MMGLSDSDPYQSTRFSSKPYYRPTFDKWEEWFAWYPVKKYHTMFTWLDDPLPIKTYSWIWLSKIYRRKVTHGPAFVATVTSWEYATLMELLTDGY